MTQTEAPSTTGVLHAIVKAYDIRGLVGEQLTTAGTRALGGAFATLVLERSTGEAKPAVVISYDMRDSSPELSGCLRRRCHRRRASTW